MWEMHGRGLKNKPSLLPDELHEADLVLRERLPQLLGVELADQLGQAVLRDGAEDLHLLLWNEQEVQIRDETVQMTSGGSCKSLYVGARS